MKARPQSRHVAVSSSDSSPEELDSWEEAKRSQYCAIIGVDRVQAVGLQFISIQSPEIAGNT